MSDGAKILAIGADSALMRGIIENIEAGGCASWAGWITKTPFWIPTARSGSVASRSSPNRQCCLSRI